MSWFSQAIKAGGACGVGNTSDGGGKINGVGGSSVGRVKNMQDTPTTCFSSSSFRPMDSDGRSRTGPLNSTEQSMCNSSIKWNQEEGRKAFQRCDPDKGPRQMEAQIVRHCTREITAWKSIQNTFGSKK